MTEELIMGIIQKDPPEKIINRTRTKGRPPEEAFRLIEMITTLQAAASSDLLNALKEEICAEN